MGPVGILRHFLELHWCGGFDHPEVIDPEHCSLFRRENFAVRPANYLVALQTEELFKTWIDIEITPLLGLFEENERRAVVQHPWKECRILAQFRCITLTLGNLSLRGGIDFRELLDSCFEFTDLPR